MRGGHECVVFDRDPAAVAELAGEGADRRPASLDELVAKLAAPRTVWVMVPAGAATESTVADSRSTSSRATSIIDGGNSYFKDDVRRAKELGRSGIHYVDVGTSGGVWGLERGYCLMIGGAEERRRSGSSPIFEALAPGGGDIAAHAGRASSATAPPSRAISTAGPCGAGHFVKMVHNGIEYGLMQAYAEGFDILRNADTPDAAERTCATTSTSPTSPSSGGAAASSARGCST